MNPLCRFCIHSDRELATAQGWYGYCCGTCYCRHHGLCSRKMRSFHGEQCQCIPPPPTEADLAAGMRYEDPTVTSVARAVMPLKYSVCTDYTAEAVGYLTIFKEEEFHILSDVYEAVPNNVYQDHGYVYVVIVQGEARVSDRQGWIPLACTDHGAVGRVRCEWL